VVVAHYGTQILDRSETWYSVPFGSPRTFGPEGEDRSRDWAYFDIFDK
jgi:hypothetical protein